jgi:hypothetical protein
MILVFKATISIENVNFKILLAVQKKTELTQRNYYLFLTKQFYYEKRITQSDKTETFS